MKLQRGKEYEGTVQLGFLQRMLVTPGMIQTVKAELLKRYGLQVSTWCDQGAGKYLVRATMTGATREVQLPEFLTVREV